METMNPVIASRIYPTGQMPMAFGRYVRPYVGQYGPLFARHLPYSQMPNPAAQVAQQTAPQAPQTSIQPIAPSCPAPPHCPSLPSSETAYAAVSGKPGALLLVARDLVLRGVLIWTGVATYNAITKHEDKYALQRSIAGAAGIEVFVLAWTWWNRPKTTTTTAPVTAPAGRAIGFGTRSQRLGRV